MSVLVVEPRGPHGDAVIRRLLADGDEVRAVETDAHRAQRLKSARVHVAFGTSWDSDLIERACQNVRTLVLLEPTTTGPPEPLRDAVEGARLAGTGRIVACASEPVALQAVLDDAGLEYVILVVPSTRRRRARVTPEDLAAAVSAADDIGGEPRVVLDLAEPSAWERLGLPASR